jgi:hypothetical protein
MPSFRIDNQPTFLRMQDFFAYSSAFNGLVKSSRFAVQIIPSGVDSFLSKLGYSELMNQFTYLCEAAEFPGRGFMNMDMSYHGPNFKVPYQSDYQETAMTFLCRTDSFERQFFDDWMEIINPTSTFDFSYKDNYKCQINMFQFSDAGRRTTTDPNRETAIPSPTNSEFTEPLATYAWTFHDAWPVLVSPQPVTWADDNFQRLAVSFSYTKWTRKNRDPQSGTFTLAAGSRASGQGLGGGSSEINIYGDNDGRGNGN